MEVEYRREMNRNYMVIRPETAGNEKYTLRMLSGNRIQGLLPFQDKMVNGEVKYYYDITSKQPLNRILEHRNISGPELRAFMTELLFALKQMERFLLDERQLVFQPEYIYVEPETFRAAFCLVPGLHREFATEFCELSQYLLDYVNHSDGDAVILAFSIFKECRKINFGMDDIEQCLRKSEISENRGDLGRIEEKGEVRKNNANDSMNGLERRFGYPGSSDNERNGEYDKVNLSNKHVKTFGNDIEKETKHELQIEEEQTISAPKTIMTGIAVSIGISMVLLPVAIFAWKGMRGLYQFKWIILMVEILFAVGIAGLFSLRPDKTAESKAGEEKKKSNTKKENYANDGLFGWSSFPDITSIESPYEEKEPMFSMGLSQYKEEAEKYDDNVNDENEIQTVLLCSRPICKECRKLISVSDEKEISVGYFPFLIGKNRNLTDYCLNKPGVSRMHVKLEEKDNGYTVTDLNSTNGTSVNGRLLEANETAALILGDELMIAGERFYFR